MSLPFICRPCRQRLLCRSRLQPITEIGRQFSFYPNNQSFQDEHPLKDTRRSERRRSHESLRHDSLHPHGQSGVDSFDGRASGRYSRRSNLHPQQLLGQLQTSSARKRTDRRPENRDQKLQSSSRPPAPRSLQVHPDLYAKARFFWHPNSSNLTKWELLQELLREYGADKDALRSLDSLVRFQASGRSLVSFNAILWVQQTLGERLSEAGASSPRHILSKIKSFRAMLEYSWPTVVWLVAREIFEGAHRLNQDSDSSFPTLMGRSKHDALHEAMTELMGLWHMAMASHLNRSPSQELDTHPALDWSFLPDSELLTRSLRDKTTNVPADFDMTMSTLLPTRGSIFSRDEVACAMVLTLELLNSLSQVSTEAQSDFTPDHPFAKLFSEVFRQYPRSRILLPLSQRLDSLQNDSLRHQYRTILGKYSNADAIAAPGGEDVEISSSAHNDSSQSAESSESRFVSLTLKRIGRAAEKNDARMLESIKGDVLNASRGQLSTSIPDLLYERLLLTTMILRQPKSTAEIWSQFLGEGRSPTVRTYTTMMRGAQHMRDINMSEAFWQKIRSSGIQPDATAWSIRLLGLIRSGRVDPGMVALAEMSSDWLKAARSKLAGDEQTNKTRRQMSQQIQIKDTDLIARFPDDIDGVPRPTVIILNTAVSALAAMRDGKSLIGKVMAWGQSFGLRPDAVTYNALLNLSLRDGENEGATEILERMQREGIEIDSTTWTVLLTNLFESGTLNDLPPDEVENKVLSYFDSFQNASPTGVDAKGYALAIDRLLKRHQNPSAAQAVLRRMTSHGLEPTPYIYTILMTSLFAQTPEPNFPAIESLWQHIQAQRHGHGATLDDVFYDRMIEGYAAHHQRAPGIEPALDFYHRLARLGRKPGWMALTALVRALAERGDGDRLVGIVDDVRRGERQGRLAGGRLADSQAGRVMFCRVVVESGALRAQGITRPEQVLETEMTGRGTIS